MHKWQEMYRSELGAGSFRVFTTRGNHRFWCIPSKTPEHFLPASCLVDTQWFIVYHASLLSWSIAIIWKIRGVDTYRFFEFLSGGMCWVEPPAPPLSSGDSAAKITRIGWLGLLTNSCSSSWSWSWSWTRPAGVPTEGLGRGAANKGGWIPQDPDPKSFHRTIWPFLWPNW